jgi:hypothetical protein
MSKKIIISRYSEDVSWINKYKINDYDYIIYNKGDELDKEYNQKKCENIGNNQRDIFEFIYENYDNLPDYMVFLQGNPIDHLTTPIDFSGDREVFLFDKLHELISRDKLTYIENFDGRINGAWSRLTDGYEEINNSWYIPAVNATHNQTCRWDNFDRFMNDTFKNHSYNQWLRFTPGSQYVLPKEIALHYSKEFWKSLMDILNRNNMTEGHIIERSLGLLFRCYLEPYI